jgi:hypothetical protein
VLRLNCEAMSCTSLGRESEDWSRMVMSELRCNGRCECVDR